MRLNMFEQSSSDAMKPLLFEIIKSLTPLSHDIEFMDERVEQLPDATIKTMYQCVRRKMPEMVFEELKREKEKILFFVDDNLFYDRESAIDLFRKIAPLKKKWACQISMDAARDDELLHEMKRAGHFRGKGISSDHAAAIFERVQPSMQFLMTKSNLDKEEKKEKDDEYKALKVVQYIVGVDKHFK